MKMMDGMKEEGRQGGSERKWNERTDGVKQKGRN